MKYLSIYILAFYTLFTGCTKRTDSIFDKTVDERLNETLTNYQTALTAAPGWKLFVYPQGLASQDVKVGGLTYYLRFTNNNRVTMVSDFNNTIVSYTPKESGWRLKALQRPSLIFDTYSYMHIAADPDPAVSLSPTGIGGDALGTDFNFSFTEITPKDTIKLVGNFNNSAAMLVKATQAEMDAAFTGGRLRDIINVTATYLAANPFIYFQANASQRVSVGFDLDNSFISFSSAEGGNLVNRSIAMSYTTYGLHLMEPVALGNYTFQDVYWDDAKKIYYILAGTTHVEFLNATAPVITVSLTSIIGNQYTLISVPPGAGLPNESPLFLTGYNQARSGMLSGPYALRLDDMDFEFTAGTKTMALNVYIFQGNNGFLAQFLYSYTVDASGYFKFTRVSQNGNAGIIAGNMSNILKYIDSDQFKVDGFATSSSFLGQMTSRQTPAFYFAGYLY